jgi:hypothetical protein
MPRSAPLHNVPRWSRPRNPQNFRELTQRKDAVLLEKMTKKRAQQRHPALNSKVSPQYYSLVPQLCNHDGWEIAALQGIKKKGLSLTRGWNEKTWINKSTIYERLKLLKDDGFNIAPLQDVGVSSEIITKAVLAQAMTRKQQSTPQARSQPLSSQQCEILKASEANARRKRDDSLFNYLEYRPRRSFLLKRKRNVSTEFVHSETSISHYTSNNHEKPAKRQCTIDLRMANHDSMMQCEEEVPTWDTLKHKVLTDIFRSSRHKGQPAKDTARIRIRFPPSVPSTITLLTQSPAAPNPSGLELNSKGYDAIMLELHVLSNAVHPCSTLTIFDPDNPDSEIHVTKNVSEETMIEGSAEAVTGLLLRLRTPGVGLAHMAKRFFDDEGVRRAKGHAFELSNKTQEQLARIEETLREGKDSMVWWYDIGKSPGWSKRLF